MRKLNCILYFIILNSNLKQHLIYIVQSLFAMGASNTKTIQAITNSKYSFPHIKSSKSFQIYCWKYTEQQLNSNNFPGVSCKWPFKFFSDEGYILAIVENLEKASLDKSSKKRRKPQIQFGSMSVSTNIMELLYSIFTDQVEQYYVKKVKSDSHNSKYFNQQLQLSIFVFVGENLLPQNKLKVFHQASIFENYMARGGVSAIGKLYYQYDQIFDLQQEIFIQNSKQNQKKSTFLAPVTTLIKEKLKLQQSNKDKHNVCQEQLLKFFIKFNRNLFIKKALIEHTLNINVSNHLILTQSNLIQYPKIKKSNFNHLIVETQFEKKEVPVVKKIQLDPQESLPFICQITEINIQDKIDKKKNKNEEGANDSLFIGEGLALLQQKRTDFVKMQIEEEDYIVLTDYTSSRDYLKCQEFNIGLVINLTASQSFNYFLADFQYQWQYLPSFSNKNSHQPITQFNIQCLIFRLTQLITVSTIQNKKGNSMNSRVLIYSSVGVFNDQSCAVVIGYMITRYLYTIQKSLSILNQCYQRYNKSPQMNYVLNKVYYEQLSILESRVLSVSEPSYNRISNVNNHKAYHINLLSSPSGQVMARYIGQLNNINQLQSLPNHSKCIFVIINNQICSSLLAAIQKWSKDANTKPQSLVSGLKIMVGKDFQFKDEYIHQIKEIVPNILKYQFVNRSLCKNIYQNNFLHKFIAAIVESNIQVENIEKSFRKPQPFNPLPFTNFEMIASKPQQKGNQPFNLKEKLVFKYPYLRPIWEPIKDDQYYFIIEVKEAGANVQIVKGINWIGLEDDKQSFFANIIKTYFEHIDQGKIWIIEKGEDSLFGDEISIG